MWFLVFPGAFEGLPLLFVFWCVSTDGMIGMAIITGAFGVVGLVAGGIIAAASSSSRKK
jgi:hypothetical protein